VRHVRQSLPDDVARIVVCSIVGSRLDYCNSLFVGMTDCNFKKLQRVQNTLAQVVLRAGKFEHITPAFIKLHWLPVQQRVLYKQAFNVLRHNSPSYLRDLLTIHNPSRNLRSSSYHLLSVGYMRTLFHLRVVTNTLPLLTGTIYRTAFETVALLTFLSVNLKVIVLALPILRSHVSPQRLRITFFVTYGAL